MAGGPKFINVDSPLINPFVAPLMLPGADPGRGANPSWRGAPTYNFAQISKKKLHEIETF